MDDQIALVVVGFIIAFILAFGIGANDVANSFGTSVGSKVLTLRQACILATIFEILGSILIGAKVSGTIRKGIVDPLDFEEPLLLMLGYVSALTGCCIWLIVATVLNLPVSGTHSIVGATIGMAIVSKNIGVVNWWKVLEIVASWFVSPVLSGIVSLLLFLLIRKYILRAASPLKAGLKFLPIIYMVTICVNVGGILEASPPSLGFESIPWWGKLAIVLGMCVVVYLSVWIFLVPFMKKKVEKTLALNLQKKLDSDLEREKFNPSQPEQQLTFDNNNNKVCYVNLKVTENNEDDAKLPIYEELKETNKQISQNKINIVKCSPNPVTVNPLVEKFLNKNPRERLISAPSHIDSDLDVNLTLRGYLHTIHTTIHTPLALKNMMQIKESKSHQGGHSLSRIFREPENKDSNTETKDLNVIKRGRFNIVPGKVNHNESSEQANLVGCDESPEKMKPKKEQINVEIENCHVQVQVQNMEKKVEDIDDLSHSDPPEAAKIFSFLQILTAIFGAFAHGGNDVSNAIGPLIGLFLIYQEGKIATKAPTPEWILLYGGVGISVGLWILGRRVIKTIGEDLTKITASSGFVIEIASAMTVLAASLLHIPVSTTHCKVGSIVFTGRVRSKESVDWSLFRNIIIAWSVTVPVTGLIAAGCQFCLMKIYF